jgi:hypothetical protein
MHIFFNCLVYNNFSQRYVNPLGPIDEEDTLIEQSSNILNKQNLSIIPAIPS